MATGAGSRNGMQNDVPSTTLDNVLVGLCTAMPLMVARAFWRVVTSVVLIGVIAGAGYYGLVREKKTTTTATTQEAKVTLGSLSTTLTASGTAAAFRSAALVKAAIERDRNKIGRAHV